jgi:cyclopropane fatty-acyl-phospholipid synthase-like methyltransferase
LPRNAVPYGSHARPLIEPDPNGYRERLSGLYDWLSRFNLLTNMAMFGAATADLTMHKTLQVQGDAAPSYTGAAQRLWINDLALDAAQPGPEPHVLDAGCGFGGTIFRWHEKAGGRYDGLTLSRVQHRLAVREALRRGIDRECRFHLRSYDDPIAERYDVVVSIEAVVHSPAFPETLQNLSRALRPGGKLVLAEDIPLAGAEGDSDLEKIRKYWGLARVPTEDTYRAAIEANGLRVLHDTDYSEGFRTSAPEKLAKLETRYLRLYDLIPLEGPRFVLAAFLGGLALERLYQKRLVKYRLLVLKREN